MERLPNELISDILIECAKISTKALLAASSLNRRFLSVFRERPNHFLATAATETIPPKYFKAAVVLGNVEKYIQEGIEGQRYRILDAYYQRNGAEWPPGISDLPPSLCSTATSIELFVGGLFAFRKYDKDEVLAQGLQAHCAITRLATFCCDSYKSIQTRKLFPHEYYSSYRGYQYPKTDNIDFEYDWDTPADFYGPSSFLTADSAYWDVTMTRKSASQDLSIWFPAIYYFAFDVTYGVQMDVWDKEHLDILPLSGSNERVDAFSKTLVSRIEDYALDSEEVLLKLRSIWRELSDLLVSRNEHILGDGVSETPTEFDQIVAANVLAYSLVAGCDSAFYRQPATLLEYEPRYRRFLTIMRLEGKDRCQAILQWTDDDLAGKMAISGRKYTRIKQTFEHAILPEKKRLEDEDSRRRWGGYLGSISECGTHWL